MYDQVANEYARRERLQDLYFRLGELAGLIRESPKNQHLQDERDSIFDAIRSLEQEPA